MDEALLRLGMTRRVHTRELAIGGGRDWPADEALRAAWLARVSEKTGLLEERVWRNCWSVTARGRLTWRLTACLEEDEMSRRMCLATVGANWRGSLAQEAVVHLDDFLLRRSLLAMCGRVTASGLAEAAEVLGAGAGLG